MLPLASCNSDTDFEIELDEYTPPAFVGEEYDFTDVLYIEDGVEYQLDVYYQNYKTMEEHTLPVVDTFYFTPVELFDLTVVVNAKKGKKTAKRTRHVPVTYNPEEATRYNLEMCNYEAGNWRGTGSLAEISYSETLGNNSKTSRKITFKNSWDLPDIADPLDESTVNASFNLATTRGLGVNAGINGKECILSFDIKMSKEFFNSENNRRNNFSFKIEDDSWNFGKALYLNLMENVSEFTIENTNDGWLHVEQNLYDEDDFIGLGSGTYVITFGFYGITNTTRESASIVLDNIALTDIPQDQKGVREIASRNNIEMCHYENGPWRGTGSKSEISYTELRGDKSTSSRKITFAKSEDLPDAVDDENNATVNASFNLAVTSSIGEDNDIDINNCTLSFDIKLTEEFFDSGHQYRHMFSFKVEDGEWETNFTWLSFVDDHANFTYAKTDNGWMHVTHNLSLNPELATVGDSTYVITFGFFGITNTTRHTASVIFDNIALIANS